MAQAVEQAQKQRELSKRALVADLDRFEARVREELDLKGRIQRDGARILALGGVVVVLIGGIIVLRARFGRRHDRPAGQPASFDDVAAELREIRKALEKQPKGKSGLPQKVLLRAVAAAGAAAGSVAARQMLARQAAVGAREDTGKPSAR